MVEIFSANVAKVVGQIFGSSPSLGYWSIVSSPKRRYKERNFAPLVSSRLAGFYEDVAKCHSKHLVGAVNNIIVFDDFVTFGATMISMRNLIMPLQKKLVFFTAIPNKL